ncbi:cardiolipin synthase [Bacillus sp. RO3]|nr:cardiolipin synthase [Bacillus sp. RO3]
MKKGLIGLLLLAASIVVLFMIMHWDVRQGVKNYTRTHPITETITSKASISVYNTGESVYEVLFEDIRRAESFVWIHFFIIRDDEVSNRFFDLLIKKAQEGVDVRLSADLLGSDIKKKTVKRMEEGGVNIVKSRPLSLKNLFYSVHHRNHRRLISIDGNTAYMGGFNMGDEYLGKDPELGYWRDYHIRLEGDAAKDVALQFKRDWLEDGGNRKGIHTPYVPIEEREESNVHFIFSTGDSLVNKTIEWIDGAQESLTITTPYFIPNAPLIAALKKAVNRGVEVKILVPDDTDAWFTKPPSYQIEKSLLESGIDLYLYEKGFFHGKVMVIDHKWADIGTANWDPRSFYLNDESNCIIRDEKIARELESLIHNDIHDSEKLTMNAFNKLPAWEKALRKTPRWVYYYF